MQNLKKQDKYQEKGDMGQRTLEGFIIDRWKAYRTASDELKLDAVFKVSGKIWAADMATYRAAQKQWMLAKSLAEAHGIHITL